MALDPKTRARINHPTQEHLEIKEVLEDLLITRTGSIALVVQTTAVNFDLLSENEQDNKIYAFAGLLNSLNFQIQILIRTKRIDISNYITYLKGQTEKASTPGLQKQLLVYTNFVQNLIVRNDVLDKKFYIVIPYNPGSAMVGAKMKKVKGATAITDSTKEHALEQGRIFLYPKRDHILKQIGRMGLHGHQLTDDELIELFYDIYNPEE